MTAAFCCCLLPSCHHHSLPHALPPPPNTPLPSPLPHANLDCKTQHTCQSNCCRISMAAVFCPCVLPLALPTPCAPPKIQTSPSLAPLAPPPPHTNTPASRTAAGSRWLLSSAPPASSCSCCWPDRWASQQSPAGQTAAAAAGASAMVPVQLFNPSKNTRSSWSLTSAQHAARHH
jgi:hypothetical protein